MKTALILIFIVAAAFGAEITNKMEMDAALRKVGDLA